MDFFEVVNKRCSYRGEFELTEIPEADLNKILEAGIKAPSGKNGQTTYFLVVTDSDLLRGLNDIFPHKGISTAPAIIVVLSTYKEVYQDTAFELQDYSAAVENMLLAVTALGYATVWTDGETKGSGRQEKITRLLNIPGNYTVQALLPIGIPVTDGKQAPKMPMQQRVFYNKF